MFACVKYFNRLRIVHARPRELNGLEARFGTNLRSFVVIAEVFHESFSAFPHTQCRDQSALQPWKVRKVLRLQVHGWRLPAALRTPLDPMGITGSFSRAPDLP